MREIIHDKVNKKFVLPLDEGDNAEVVYTIDCGVLRLVHSYVPQTQRGNGIGKELVEKTFQKLSDESFEATAVCSYIKAIAMEHPKWSTIINY